MADLLLGANHIILHPGIITGTAGIIYMGSLRSLDYYSYSPMYSNWWWRNQYYNNQAVRHHADNITILSFDKTGKLEWSNVIHKQQFDDGIGAEFLTRL